MLCPDQFVAVARPGLSSGLLLKSIMQIILLARVVGMLARKVTFPMRLECNEMVFSFVVNIMHL